MLFKTAGLIAAAAIGGAAAQSRPSNTSMCDYYTTALLKDNTAENQAKLLTLVVNTAVIGNYTMPNVGVKVAGILANGTYNGTDVSLLPYFSGGLASTNRDGKAVSVNFLDDGGAAPLMMNKPANGTSSNQYMLLNHLYTYFGVLLGCTMQGQSGFGNYTGSSSQYKVHMFMDLSAYEVGYFITQVGMSAASFGVSDDDVMAVGMALTSTFDYKCSPPAAVVPSQGEQLQSICTGDMCPLSPNATSTCSGEMNNGTAMEPSPSNSSNTGPTAAATSASSMPSGTAASTSGAPAPQDTSSGAAYLNALSIGGLVATVAGIFAAAL